MDTESPASRHSEHFLMLGHDHGVYYYLSKSSGQVVPIRPDNHVESRFVMLAPKQWWELHYPGKGGADWSAARNALIQFQHAVGIYDPSRVRGRGAWWDGERAVLHLGDKLLIGDDEFPLATPSRYIYESAIPFRINHLNPMGAKDSVKLLRMCEMLSWEKAISSKYLAGWLALAPVGGALQWRPHVWIHGGSGAGKSWTFNNIITKLIGQVSQPAQFSTTEAGLRQTLGHDAKPVIFDEADAKDMKAQLRIDNVLELARSASTEGSPAIIKGNPDGQASTWRVRSCFLLSSINYGATTKADVDRISALSMVVDKNKERFAQLSMMVSKTLTDEYVDRFLARSIRMIPIIRENARIFSAASAPVLGNQRAGDQVGTLLAGAYSLASDKAITPDGAREYIQSQDWTEEKVQSEITDEIKCRDRIFQAIVKAPSRQHGLRDISIGDLIRLARADDPLDSKFANEALNMRGIRADEDGIIISRSHSGIAQMLKDTEWNISWGRTLRRLPGAADTNGSARFGATRSQGVKIPYPDVDEECGTAQEPEESLR